MLELKCKKFTPSMDYVKGKLTTLYNAEDHLCDFLNEHPDYQIVSISVTKYISFQFQQTNPEFYLFYRGEEEDDE